MNKQTSKLTLICDPGTSLIKVLYRVGRKGQLKHTTMDAEILKLDADIVANFNKSSEFGRPEDNAWLQLKDNSDHQENIRLEQGGYSVCYLYLSRKFH